MAFQLFLTLTFTTLLWLSGQAHELECSTGFTPGCEYCYAFIDKPQTWQEAEATCKTLGGYLAEPRSFQENIYVKGLVLHHAGNHVWLGAEDIVTEGKWFWATAGSSVDSGYSDWTPGEPDDYKLGQDCMIVHYTQRHWDDASCGGKYQSVCQKSPNSDVLVG